MPQDPQVSELIEKIRRLSRGDAVTIGGPSDVGYLREQIARLQLPSETTSQLVEMLDEVNPELSTREAREKRNPGLVRASQIPREDFVERYGIEERVVDTIGLEALRASEILRSNYHGFGPFVARLPESLTPAQVERLIELGYESMKLGKNEALALFIDLGRVRRAEKLRQDPHLDKKIAEFMRSEAGNRGQMYFIGPPSDDEQEIEDILSPMTVKFYSSFMGIPMVRDVTNLIGAIPEGAIVYREQTTVLVAPDD